MTQWGPPKTPQDADFYELEIDPAWLGQSPVDSVTFQAKPSSGLTLGTPSIQENVARVFVSGGNVGTHRIGATVVSAGRTREAVLLLTVKEI